MAKLGDALDKVMRSRPVKWAGYLAWIVILLLLLSFVWGNIVEYHSKAAFVGGIIFIIMLELGIGIRLLAKSIVKKKRE